MRSERASLGLRLGAGLGLAFLHVPMAFILLYAFTTEDKSYQFPPPGLTLRWLAVAWQRPDIWSALRLSLQVAALAMVVALILGTLAAAALWRSTFFGRDAVTLLLILPLALPGGLAAPSDIWSTRASASTARSSAARTSWASSPTEPPSPRPAKLRPSACQSRPADQPGPAGRSPATASLARSVIADPNTHESAERRRARSGASWNPGPCATFQLVAPSGAGNGGATILERQDRRSLGSEVEW
jgi:hypothetical protein